MWYALIGLGLYAGAKALEKNGATIESGLNKLDRKITERRERKALAKAANEQARQTMAALCATDLALELERKRLEVERLSLEVEAAKRRLNR